MMRFLLILIFIPSLLCGDHYWGIALGGTLASPEAPFVLDQFPHPIRSWDQDGLPTFEMHHIDLKGKYKPGYRFTLTSGYQFWDHYRIEFECSYASDKVSVRKTTTAESQYDHTTYRKVGYDPKIYSRRAMGFGLNGGGHLLHLGPVSPYSLVGAGIRGSYIAGRKPVTHLYYQWIIGLELEIDFPARIFIQHRMQKALKNDGIHAVEVGVRTNL